MPVADALAHAFSRNARMRGEEYAAVGRVRLKSAAAGTVEAVVRGTDMYGVAIRREDTNEGAAFDVVCDCPQFLDNHVACKHLWAVLRSADERNALGDLAKDARAFLRSPDLDDRRDEDPPPGPVSRSAGPRQPASAGEKFLRELHQGLDAITSAPPTVSQHTAGELIYLLSPPQASVPGVGLTTMWRKRKKSGEWGKPKVARISDIDVETAAEPDRTILALLTGARAQDTGWYGYGSYYQQVPGSVFTLSRTVAAMVLPMAAQTGRLAVDVPADLADPVFIAWDDGEPWRVALEVASGEHGFTVRAAFVRAGEQLDMGQVALVLSSGFLIASLTLSRLSLDGVEDMLMIALLSNQSPIEIAHKDAARLGELLARAGVPGDRLPADLRFTSVRPTPVPCLRLTSGASYRTSARLDADVSFDYDGVRVPSDAARVHVDAATRQLIHREPGTEQAAMARLNDVGFRTEYDYRGHANILWLASYDLPRVVRVLAVEGWRIEAEGRVWRTAGQVRMSVSSGIDWLDLEASVTFGDTSVDLPRILTALQRGESFVRLDDGSVGTLPEDWLKRYAPLAAAGTVEDGRLRFRPSQAALLDALLAAQADRTAVTLDEGFLRLRDELARFDRVQAEDAPAGFKGLLRPYQMDALGWFRFLRQFGFGGCLADDMGLGKTVMVLALLEWRRAEFARTGDGRRTSVIVVPRSLVSNWIAEAARFAPQLRVIDYSGTGRGAHAGTIGEADVLIATYGTLRRDVTTLKDTEFEYVILDEAQAIKNATTVSAKAARLIQGRHRLALSGTPIENHLGELWSLFEFLNPGLLGSSSFFQKTTAKAKPDDETAALLSRGLRPFFLRRTKQQVARDLPSRTEQTLHCELDRPARELYDGLRRHYREALLPHIDRVGMGKSGMKVLEALLRLRQAACHPALIDRERHGNASAKFDVLLPRLREVVAEGHKALVFSQFTSLLALLKDVLDAEGLHYEYLDGKTRDRAARVTRFQQDPDVPLFLISLKAGGLGLNLTAAEYVFLLDPWWNPAVEAQAIDRTHRIGQTREVFAYRIIATDTVEEKVLALQQSKRALADAVLAESATGLRHLTRDDLALLLS